ncbi:hypothetical protein GGR57DRAFT_141206 [Xylariaceae sp. FL1272]|nr:hypothetical protein GGR57DRAFT_141206 [Xylariaceae sp. FL1272]
MNIRLEYRYEDIEDALGAMCWSIHWVDLHHQLKGIATAEPCSDNGKNGGENGHVVDTPVKIRLGCECWE